MKRTKIICTLGPASNNRETLKALMENGMDIARFNFSHGDHEEQKGRVDMIKELREELDMPIAMLLDTKGPEIRTRLLKDGQKVKLESGNQFVLGIGDFEGDDKKVAITYETLYKDVKPGNKILIDDGLIELEVKAIKGTDIICDILNGGELGEKKGVNVPYVKVNLPGITEQDKNDILFGIEQKFDFIAASFVRSAEVIREIRKLLNDNGGKDIGIIAKIENAEGVENIDSIIEASDGIMVARGDLGVEIPAEEVPYLQKLIIQKCNDNYKPVITATQMLDSMIRNPRPTRAETTDVANAIYDGTSAVMLSGESAAGKYPVEAVEMMAKIAERAEAAIDYKKNFFHYERAANQNVTDAVCHAACTTAIDLNAAAVIIVTKSGVSARNISKYRPSCNIIAGTTSDKAYRQLNMSWGVTPVHLEEQNEVFTLFDHAVAAGKKQGLLQPGDKVVIGAGVPLGISGNTNMLKVQVVE